MKYITTTDRLTSPDVYHPSVAVVERRRCVGCMECLKLGHCEAVVARNGKATISQENCVGCGVCASVCPVHAISYRRLE